MDCIRLPGVVRKFFSSSAIYFLGSGINRAIPFFLLPLLTRWLTTADYGFIGTFNAVRNNIQPVIGMASSGAVIRARVDAEKKDFDFSAYIFNAFFVNIVLFGLVLLMVFPLQGFIRDQLHFPPSWIFLVALISLFSLLGGVKSDLWVYEDRAWIFGFSQILLSALNIGLSLFILKMVWMDWRGRLGGVFAAEALFCFFSLAYLWKENGIRFRLNKDYIKSVLSFGLPLYPHSLGLMMLAAADKFFLNAFLGMEVLGVYTVGYTFASILHVLVMPFDMATTPRIYKMLNNNEMAQKEQFVCLYAVYFLFFLFFSFLLSALIPFFLKFFVGEKFYGANQYIFWIMMGQFFMLMYRIPSRWINFAKKNYHFSWMTFTSGLVAVLASYLLIPWVGAVGAAQAVLLAYFTLFALTSFMAQKLYPMPWGTLFKTRVWKELVWIRYSR